MRCDKIRMKYRPSIIITGAAQRSSKKGSEHRKEDVVYALSQIIEQRVTERPDIFSFIRYLSEIQISSHLSGM